MFRFSAHGKSSVRGTTILAAATLFGALMFSGTAHAAPPAGTILGGMVWAGPGPVTATILDSDSGFLNAISLYSPHFQFIGFDDGPTLFPNLGTFTECEELIFGVFNPEGTFVTGPASRNPDNLMHAAIDWIDADTVHVYFEDKFNGFDLDYNDAILQVDGVQNCVPEPASLSLLGMGLVGAIARRRRKA